MTDCKVNIFEVVKGDSFQLNVNLYDESGRAYSMKSTQTLELCIAHPSNPTLSLATILSKNGLFETKITLDVGRYIFDVCLKDSSDASQRTFLVSKNNVLIVLPKIGGV